MDEKAVKLVCAAALARGTTGRCCWSWTSWPNLGKQHRTEAVALFERIGRDRNITVIVRSRTTWSGTRSTPPACT